MNHCKPHWFIRKEKSVIMTSSDQHGNEGAPENATNLNGEKARLPFYRRPVFLGILLGLLGGYIYYLEIGCKSGTCPLTSNPWTTMAWGGVMGYLVGDLFTKKPSSKE